jgi:hypothetical protein
MTTKFESIHDFEIELHRAKTALERAIVRNPTGYGAKSIRWYIKDLRAQRREVYKATNQALEG